MKKTLSVLMAFLLLFGMTLIPSSGNSFWTPSAHAAGEYLFTDISDQTVSSRPAEPCQVNIIIFGRPNSVLDSVLSDISLSLLISDPSYHFIYADIDGNDKETVTAFSAGYSQDITYCYGNYRETMWRMYGQGGTVSLPMLVFVDTKGDVRCILQGYQTEDTITEELYKIYRSDTPSGDTVSRLNVGIRGHYFENSAEALAMINRIRYEAYAEGVKNPSDPTQSLKLEDYHPLKWSSALENTARIRAVEALVYQEHTRPNGKGCFSIDDREVDSLSEVLAWNYTTDMCRGIQQFYDEKADWVNGTGGETGHYEALILPDAYYIGLGAFYSYESGNWPSSLCGRIGGYFTGIDETQGEATDEMVVTIQVSADFIRSAKIRNRTSTSDTIDAGSSCQLEMYSPDSENNNAFIFVERVTWSSSDESVATVSDEGVVTARSEGYVTITASTVNNLSASLRLHVTGEAPATEPPTQPPAPTVSYLLGDTDGDSEVTILDATVIQRHLADMEVLSFDFYAADADEDEEITILDTTSIQRYLADMLTNPRIGTWIDPQGVPSGRG